MKNIIQPKPPKASRFFYGLLLLIILFGTFSVFIANNYRVTKIDLQKTDQPGPAFSAESGFYNAPFALSLSSDVENGKIVYTLDGSIPDNNSKEYSKPIIINSRENDENVFSEIPTSPRWQPPLKNVNKAMVVRAAVISGSDQVSKVSTHTFFVSENNRMGYTLPVISLVSDEKNLFAHKMGIYVMGKTYEDKDNYISKNIPLDLPWWRYPANYSEHGKKSYRPVEIELFDTDNAPGFSIHADMRVSGNATRGYSQKSLSIYFKKSNEKGTLDYKLFKNDAAVSFKDIVLRNAGNDWDKAFIRDAFIENMLKAAGYDAPAYRSVIVFINGEYWGVHQMSERMDEGYLSLKYNLDLSTIKIAKYLGADNFGNKFDDPEYMSLLRFVKEKDLAVPENFEVVKEKIDLDNYADYIIAEVFCANSDWPHNNFLFWRSVNPLKNHDSSAQAPKDGRFRWMMTDFDYGYGATTDVSFNMLPKAMQDYLFSRLITNSEFKKLFLQRFQEQLNTTFRSEKAVAGIDSLQALLLPEMQQQVDRWRVLGSVERWKGNISVMRDFALKRPQIQADQLNAFFRLRGQEQIRIKKQ